MTDQQIQCPHCQQMISLTDSLTKHLRTGFEEAFAKERAALEQTVKVEQQKQAEAYKKQQEALQQQQVQLQEAQATMERQVAERVEKEKKQLWELAQVKAKEKQDMEMKDLLERTKSAEEKLKQAQEEELELRKQKRALEERERTMALEMEKKLDGEREQLLQKARKEALEEERLKTLEYRKQIEMMNRQIEELKQKGTQGSQQLQGEVQEEELKSVLAHRFPMDVITDVPQGIRGADLVQEVRTTYGQRAGILLWESKNTKTWSQEWIKKLKDDQGLVKADMCILVSRALPEGIESFGMVDGVWVTASSYVLPLTFALRSQLLSLQQMKLSAEGKDEKMQQLYEYLSGAHFKHRVESIVDAFTGLKQDLEAEKRAFARMWSKREKELERVMSNTSGLYGDLEGIIGRGLPSIGGLEVPLLDDLTAE